MTKTEIERVQAYLRRLLGSERVRVVAPSRAGASVEVAVGEEVVGTLHRDVEDGEVSYAVHLTILEEDLPPASTPSLAGAQSAQPARMPRTTAIPKRRG